MHYRLRDYITVDTAHDVTVYFKCVISSLSMKALVLVGGVVMGCQTTAYISETLGLP